MNQSEWERSRAEAEQLQEKVEKSQGEIYRLKAKLENAQSEKENLQVSDTIIYPVHIELYLSTKSIQMVFIFIHPAVLLFLKICSSFWFSPLGA
jgi:predicted nuclease with TOPRIM domain